MKSLFLSRHNREQRRLKLDQQKQKLDLRVSTPLISDIHGCL